MIVVLLILGVVLIRAQNFNPFTPDERVQPSESDMREMGKYPIAMQNEFQKALVGAPGMFRKNGIWWQRKKDDEIPVPVKKPPLKESTITRYYTVGSHLPVPPPETVEVTETVLNYRTNTEIGYSTITRTSPSTTFKTVYETVHSWVTKTLITPANPDVRVISHELVSTLSISYTWIDKIHELIRRDVSSQMISLQSQPTVELTEGCIGPVPTITYVHTVFDVKTKAVRIKLVPKTTRTLTLVAFSTSTQELVPFQPAITWVPRLT